MTERSEQTHRSDLTRTVSRYVILGMLVVVLVNVAIAIAYAAQGGALDGPVSHESVVIASFAAMVVVGVISGIGAASIAGSDHPARRRYVLVLCVAMTALVGATVLAAELLAGATVEHDIGQLVRNSLVVTAVPVLLGTLLGYTIGRERRVAREGNPPR